MLTRIRNYDLSQMLFVFVLVCGAPAERCSPFYSLMIFWLEGPNHVLFMSFSSSMSFRKIDTHSQFV